jgi:glucose-1-phosphate thymidylyltransferase
MKGLILSGGKGTRLRPITFTSAKQLVPVANKPVLFYAIEALVSAGIAEIGIIIGDTGAEVKAAVGNGDRFNCKVTYIQQDAPLGLAHAVKIAQDFMGKDKFLMYLGDNILEQPLLQMVREFEENVNCNCQILLKEVPNPQAFGVAVLEGDQVVRLIEKPAEPPSNLALVGVYMFDANVFEAVNSIKPSWRNELEITDAIQYLVTNNYKVKASILQGYWADTGKQSDMLETNRLVLERLREPKLEGFCDADTVIDGRVVIGKGAEIINSRVRGPVIIGEGCRIVNSYIGPFSAIDKNCTITNSEVEYSIVMENSKILDVDHRIEDSLIGRNVTIEKSSLKPKAHKFLLGDNSNVGIL